MSSYRLQVYDICKKIIDPKYKWITHRHASSPYPKFRLPDDPTEDIEEVMSLKPEVYKNSKGTDGGECFCAADFKDNGFKLYRANINGLMYLRKNWPSGIERPSDEEMDLAIKRWEMLERCSFECNIMMRKLRYNN
jgi:hypothetical protein